MLNTASGYLEAKLGFPSVFFVIIQNNAGNQDNENTWHNIFLHYKTSLFCFHVKFYYSDCYRENTSKFEFPEQKRLLGVQLCVIYKCDSVRYNYGFICPKKKHF